LSEVWFWLPFGALAVGLAALLVRDGIQLRRLVRWALQPLGTPVPDAGGKWGDAFAALHQRARLAAEQREQLNEALERFRQAAQAMPDGVAILGGKLAIEWLNGQAEQLLGLDSRRDVGAPIINLVREPDFIATLQGRHDGEPRLVKSIRKPGQSLQVRAIPFGQGRIMLLVRDITQIERLETMRRDFVANVSHELKTPLTVVAGFVETLADGWQDLSPSEAQHLLGLAGEQAARMQRLIEDLLTLSALETNAPPQEERVDMAALLAEVREEATVLSAGRHEISLLAEGPAALLGNARELRSAFGNLVTNAVRYTPAGGRIDLRWQWLNGDIDAGVAFVVADTGIGIEAQHIPRLTERFYRVDRGRSRESGGTGLGLAIVKHVLERHGGYLRVQSSPGQGSRFSACLPARSVAQA
jgi:two-component system phosphate regulon sensor histidine kinase PhoR